MRERCPVCHGKEWIDIPVAEEPGISWTEELTPYPHIQIGQHPCPRCFPEAWVLPKKRGTHE
jgi:hypothetical protein